MCDDECHKCRGPGAHNCFDCQNFRIFHDGVLPEFHHNTTDFNCSAACPDHLPHKIFPDSNESKVKPFCSAESNRLHASSGSLILLAVFTGLFAVILVICFLMYKLCQKNKAKNDAVKMSKVLTGCDDSEPLRPTNVGPNLTKLRIITQNEIRIGNMLGSGAFGKVYKGVWDPVGADIKIPVAIKVLTDVNGSEASKEFLQEAYIMSSVEHTNLLKLHAICMASQLMLITQLMPLGSLLEYVQKNKDKIGSKALLNWSTQIARGMAYLEERQIVHRDLAARNVLVQTPSCVKITDFGLAKLLDYDSDTYKAAGGKMPIKWLALECIQHRIFTSKSDVWAFGVTIWELLTYGKRPYEEFHARDVPEKIETGTKLKQPDICSLDVYIILLECWGLNADARPTFKQLAETFAAKARDPGRYLVIPGDKHMRLPSYTAHDEKDLIRTLAPLEGGSNTSTILETEEYLQPKTCEGGSHEQLRFHLPKRYCSDPLRNGDETDTSREIGIGNLRLDLPLDEDDYLMPTGPSQSQPTAGYMDLVGVSQQAIDNPEYLLNSNPTANIVTISSTVKENNFQNINNNNLLNNLNNVPMPPTQTLGIPSAESVSISDHEYYNDLQREMQPLHNTRSETTV